MNSLPSELMRMVLGHVWRGDILQMRLLSRSWSQIASEVVSDRTMFDFDRLQPMVQHLRAGGTMRLVIKKLHVVIALSSWSRLPRAEREEAIAEKFGILHNLLPFLGHVCDLALFVNVDDASNVPIHESPYFDDRHFGTLSKLVQLPRLSIMHIAATTVELRSVMPFFSPSLQEIIIEHGMERSDLWLVMLFLRDLPLLKHLHIDHISSDRVDGQPLRPFIYRSLVKEHQHLNMKQLYLTIENEPRPVREPRNVKDVVYFLLFIMPNLDSLELDLQQDDSSSVTGDLAPLDETRLPGNAGCPTRLSIITDFSFAPSENDFSGPPIFQARNGARKLEFLTLDIQCLPLLSSLPMEAVHSLTIYNNFLMLEQTPPLEFPLPLNVPQLKTLRLNSLRVHFPLLSPPFPPIKSLHIDSCKFPSPGTLELLLLQLPTLKDVSLTNLTFDAWRFIPLIKLDSPWTDVLLILFASSNRARVSPRWLSLPILASTVRFTWHFEQINEYVHIALQDAQHATVPAKVWLTDTIGNRTRALTDNDVSILLQRLENKIDQQLPDADSLQSLSSPLMDTAFARICVSHRVVVYACSSFNNFILNTT